MAERLQVILELVTGNYKKEAREAATATGQIDKAAGSVTSSLGRMIGPAAIGGAVVGLVNLAQKAGENADRLFDLRAQTGLTTDALQEWEFVAKTAGAGTEVFSDAVKAVIRNLSETEGATGAAGKAYETLGIKVTDAAGNLRDAGDITDEVFVKLAGMENITARNALAQDIFGKKWEETVSILDLGSDALGNARKEAHELGAVISGESLEGADKFRETFEKLKTVLTGKLMELLGDMGPLLTDVAEGLIEVVEDGKPLIDFFTDLIGVYTDFTGALDQGKDSENAFVEFQARAIDMVLSFGGALGALLKAIEFLSGPNKEWNKDTETSKDVVEALAGKIKDDLTPALNDLPAALAPATRGLIDAKVAAIEAGAAFRDDLAADYAAAALSIDKSSKGIAVSLDTLKARLTENITDQAAFYSNLVALAEAGFTDLAEFLRGEGSAVAAGAAADLVGDLEEASSLENLIDQTERDAVRYTDALAAAMESDKARLLDIASSLGIDLAGSVEAGFSTLQLNDLLGIALGAPGLGPVQGVTTDTSGNISGTGARAFGGPISANQMYMVGERGPEMFVSGTAGNIIPNDILRAMGGGVSITVNHPNTTNLAQDVQLATLYASVKNLVEGY